VRDHRSSPYLFKIETSNRRGEKVLKSLAEVAQPTVYVFTGQGSQEPVWVWTSTTGYLLEIVNYNVKVCEGEPGCSLAREVTNGFIMDRMPLSC
jgi:hypothetical protein